MNDLVSVIIAVFNGEKYILEAIKSVRAQTYASIELIIVNDGSNDGTEELIMRHYPDVRYVSLPHQGQYHATNHAIAMASGEYLTFLDADDLFMPDKLSLLVNVLQTMPKVDMVFGGVEQFVAMQREASIRLHHNEQACFTHVSGGGLFRKTCFERAGRFNPQWEVGGFMDWYMRAREAGLQEYLISELTDRRRIHGDNKGFYLRTRQRDYLKIVKSALDRRRQEKMCND